jgi:hypothetical protein
MARPTSRGINETLGGISDMLLQNKPKEEKTIARYRMLLATFAIYVVLFAKQFLDAPQCKVGFHVDITRTL